MDIGKHFKLKSPLSIREMQKHRGLLASILQFQPWVKRKQTWNVLVESWKFSLFSFPWVCNVFLQKQKANKTISVVSHPRENRTSVVKDHQMVHHRIPCHWCHQWEITYLLCGHQNQKQIMWPRTRKENKITELG